MKLSVSGFYVSVALSVSGLALLLDPVLGAVHLLATVILIAPVRLFGVRSDSRQILLLVSGTIWVTHFVRPLVLIPRPELFSFLRLGVPDRPLLLEGLWVSAMGAAALLGGVWVGFRLARTPAPDDARPRPARPGLIARNRGAWALITLVIAVSMVASTALLGVGVLGVEATSWSFLNRLIPELLVYPVGLLLLVRYRERLSARALWFVWGALGFVTVGYFLRGSKAFLIYLAVAFVIFVLVDHGDLRLRLRQWAVLIVASGILLPITFVVGQEFRIQRNRNALASSEAAVVAVQSLASGVDGRLLASVNLVTLRMVGYDGVLATSMYPAPEVVEEFSLGSIVRGAAGQIVPGLPVPGLSAGKAIAVSYRGHDVDVVHADAIGIIASSTLTAGRWAPLYLFGLGLAIATGHGLARRVRDEDVRFLLRYGAMYFSVTLIMSGVLDRQIALMLITAVQIIALAGLVAFVNGAVGRRRFSRA